MAGETERTRQIVAALQRVPLFDGLPEGDLETLAQQVVRRRYARNEVIVAQGDDGLYVVAAGPVAISRQSAAGDELLLALCEPGEYFGDLALIDGAPRSATAVALDDCALLFLARGAFRAYRSTAAEVIQDAVLLVPAASEQLCRPKSSTPVAMRAGW